MTNNCTILTNRLIMQELSDKDLKRLVEIGKDNAKYNTEEMLNELSNNFEKYNKDDNIEENGFQKLVKYLDKTNPEVKDSDLFSFFGPMQYPFRKSIKELLEKAKSRREEEPRYTYHLGIYTKDDPTYLIGMLIITSKIYETKTGSRTGYFGYILDRNFQGRGFATEVQKAIFGLFCNYIIPKSEGFNKNTKIYATSHPLNARLHKIQHKFDVEVADEFVHKVYKSKRTAFYFDIEKVKKIVNTEDNKWIAVINNKVYISDYLKINE